VIMTLFVILVRDYTCRSASRNGEALAVRRRKLWTIKANGSAQQKLKPKIPAKASKEISATFMAKLVVTAAV